MVPFISAEKLPEFVCNSDDYCSGHGFCNASKLCQCENDWDSKPDCSGNNPRIFCRQTEKLNNELF